MTRIGLGRFSGSKSWKEGSELPPPFPVTFPTSMDREGRSSTTTPRPVVEPPPPPDGRVSATRLHRRLQALKSALEDLPRQAKRLVRWQERRKASPDHKFLVPLRSGHPPGYRRKPIHEVDDVLTECDGLAWEAMKPDTS